MQIIGEKIKVLAFKMIELWPLEVAMVTENVLPNRKHLHIPLKYGISLIQMHIVVYNYS